MNPTQSRGGVSPAHGDESAELTPQGQIIKDFFERCSNDRAAEILASSGAANVTEFVEQRVAAFFREREDALASGMDLTRSEQRAMEALLVGLTDSDEGEDGIAREEGSLS